MVRCAIFKTAFSLANPSLSCCILPTSCSRNCTVEMFRCCIFIRCISSARAFSLRVSSTRSSLFIFTSSRKATDFFRWAVVCSYSLFFFWISPSSVVPCFSFFSQFFLRSISLSIAVFSLPFSRCNLPISSWASSRSASRVCSWMMVFWRGRALALRRLRASSSERTSTISLEKPEKKWSGSRRVRVRCSKRMYFWLMGVASEDLEELERLGGVVWRWKRGREALSSREGVVQSRLLNYSFITNNSGIDMHLTSKVASVEGRPDRLRRSVWPIHLLTAFIY